MKNKYLWTSILLAILLGIAFGACHAYSVSQHRSDAQIDTFGELMVNVPTPEVKSEFKSISQPKVVFAKEETDVVRVHDDGIPTEVKEAAEKWGEVYNICPEFIEALAYQESRYQADVVSADGSCVGICQINQGCHKKRMKRLGVTDLTDIDSNIHVAADYLAEIFAEHDGEPEIVLMIFNGDSSWQKGRTSAYAKEIVERSAELERLHGK